MFITKTPCLLGCLPHLILICNVFRLFKLTMSAYSLYCSVCQSEYYSKTEWLQHLSWNSHQILARKECLEEWGTVRLRKCCLVIFSSFPLTRDDKEGGSVDKVIQHFSKETATFVSDFVWWEERPCIGVVQFESRKKVMELLLTLDDTGELLIDNARVLVKWASDLMELEWCAILPVRVGGVCSSINRTSNCGVISEESTPGDLTAPSSSEVSVNVDEDLNDSGITENSREDQRQPEYDQIPEVTSTDAEGKNAIARLKELARQRQWKKPKFTITQNPGPNPQSRFFYSVMLNGVKYKPSKCYANTPGEAKLNAAQFCLDELASHELAVNDAAVISDKRTGKRSLESEEGDKLDNGRYFKKLKISEQIAPEIGNKNPISSLMEFTQQKHWLPPTFKFHKQGKQNYPTYSCSVTVNGVVYKPDGKAMVAGTKQGAKLITAIFCLKSLTNRDSSSSTSQRTEEKEIKNTSDPSEQQKPLLRPGSLQTSVSISSDTLQYQFWCVRKSVTIPDDEYDKALEVSHQLKALFCMRDPSAEVVMFRNWHLKLRDPRYTDNWELLFFVYCSRSQKDCPNSFTFLLDNTIEQVFEMPGAQKYFTVLDASDSKIDFRIATKIGWEIKYKLSSKELKFHLITYKRFFMEAQICRLLEYMSTFDTRCHSILTLAFHWCMINSVQVGETGVQAKSLPFNLPEPLTLEWLVMLFLCYNEIIPTPREIQERPHIILNDRQSGIDVGFHADPEFSKEWISRRRTIDPTILNDDDNSSENFILSVLTLFQEFLQFCGTILDGGKWILNPRDGEIISIEKFLTCAPNKGNHTSPSFWSTKMSTKELSDLRSLQRKETLDPSITEDMENDNAPASCRQLSYKVNFREWKLYMIHPFVVTSKFSMCKDIAFVLRQMRSTASQLKKFLNMRKSNGVTAAKKRFGSLENVLKVENHT